MINTATVLHINHSTETVGITRAALQHAGYRVVETYTDDASLVSIEELCPVAILLELDAANMGSLEIVHQLRANINTAIIPVLALTPRAQSVDHLVAMQAAGIDELLVKPFTPQELVEGVRKVIQGR